MRLLPLIILLFLVVIPAVEIATFIRVGHVIGALPTILLTLFTAALGIVLVRLQGFVALSDLQRAMLEGRAPFTEMLSGALLLLAGILLLIPGFVTDAIGFLLLVPPLRRGLARLLTRALFEPLPVPAPGGMGDIPDVAETRIIEAEIIEIREPPSAGSETPGAHPRRPPPPKD